MPAGGLGFDTPYLQVYFFVGLAFSEAFLLQYFLLLIFSPFSLLVIPCTLSLRKIACAQR